MLHPGYQYRGFGVKTFATSVVLEGQEQPATRCTRTTRLGLRPVDDPEVLVYDGGPYNLLVSPGLFPLPSGPISSLLCPHSHALRTAEERKLTETLKPPL